MPPVQLVSDSSGLDGLTLPEAIPAAMVELYASFYPHDRTTAVTYIKDKIVVCVLENSLTESEDVPVDAAPLASPPSDHHRTS